MRANSSERQLSLKNDLAVIRHYDQQIFQLEEELQRQTKRVACREFTLLKTIPGIGLSLGLTILYEIGDIERFPTVKDFLSYCRLVKGTVASAGKIKGLRGAKLGNPYLRWAFGEAAVIAKRDHFRIRPLAQRLEAQMGGNKFKANTEVIAPNDHIRFILVLQVLLLTLAAYMLLRSSSERKGTWTATTIFSGLVLLFLIFGRF